MGEDTLEHRGKEGENLLSKFRVEGLGLNVMPTYLDHPSTLNIFETIFMDLGPLLYPL